MSFHFVVDDLFNQACKQYTTYEVMLIKGFSSLMDEHFDPKVVPEAFEYAREKYGYLSPDEISDMDDENESNGFCPHGLTVWTCPCGCG